MPHAVCYLWDRGLLTLHATTDILIGISYVAISTTLAVLVQRARRDIPFHWVFLAFGAFIVACGATHLMEVWTLWSANYWAAGGVKVVTAPASVAPALVLPPLVPKALELVRHAKLRDQLFLEQAARMEAESANRAKDEFLATLSHELRTPLNAVYGWARLLRAGDMTSEETAHALETIERNAHAQVQLIEDLLDVSRIVSGKVRLDIRTVDLRVVARAALDSLRPAAAAKGITLDERLDPLVGPVVGDPERLQQVIWNLLANAVKFTPRGGRVTLALARVGDAVEITVSDTGQGIVFDLLPYVFDRFRQGETGATRKHGGLGIGLSLVRHLVELHGGTVRAESGGHDQGASFTVSLPVSADERPREDRWRASMTPHAGGVASLRGRRVLVVD